MVAVTVEQVREDAEARAVADAADAIDVFIAKVWRDWPDAPSGEQRLAPIERQRAMSAIARGWLRVEHWRDYGCVTVHAELDLDSLVQAMAYANGLAHDQRASLMARSKHACAMDGR